MSSPQDDDRVWIMDPEILEDSARDHRDSPPLSKKTPVDSFSSPAHKLSQAVSFITDQTESGVSTSITTDLPQTGLQSAGNSKKSRPFDPFIDINESPSNASLSSQGPSIAGNTSTLPTPIINITNSSPNHTAMPRHRWHGGVLQGPPPTTRAFTRPVNSVGAAMTAQTREQLEFNLMEKQYLLAAERGDLASVRHYLVLAQSNKSFNINCVDPLGRTALLIAIENENIEMIETLLEANIETGDAILYAINEENVEAVEIILNQLEKKDKFTVEVSCHGRVMSYKCGT